jgi:hypothetical protein
MYIGSGGISGLDLPSAETKSSETAAALEEANRIAKEIQKKEDDDFDKMEAYFIESLGLGTSEIKK